MLVNRGNRKLHLTLCLWVYLVSISAAHPIDVDEQPIVLQRFRNSVLSIVPAVSRGMLERKLQVQDITYGTFIVRFLGISKAHCVASRITYYRVLSTSYPEVYRIPHSFISMNGIRCGTLPLNASPSAIKTDPWMHLFPISLLANETVARKHGLLRPYLLLRRGNAAKDIILSYKRAIALEKKIAAEKAKQPRVEKEFGLTPLPGKSSLFVGFEAGIARECRGEKGNMRGPIVPPGSFTLFGKNDNVSVNIRRLTHVRDVSSDVPDVVLRRRRIYHTIVIGNKRGEEKVCPYQFEQPPRITREYGVRLCFPAKVHVQIHGRGSARMEDLLIGTATAQKDGDLSSPVFMFSHRSREELREFVKLTLENGEELLASHGHLVVGVDGMLVKAGNVRVGDALRKKDGQGTKVVEIGTEIARGLYNPHTMSGYLVVNGVIVSCYTDAVPWYISHALLSPMRSLYFVLGEWEWIQYILMKMSVMDWAGWATWVENLGKMTKEKLPRSWKNVKNRRENNMHMDIMFQEDQLPPGYRVTRLRDEVLGRNHGVVDTSTDHCVCF